MSLPREIASAELAWDRAPLQPVVVARRAAALTSWSAYRREGYTGDSPAFCYRAFDHTQLPPETCYTMAPGDDPLLTDKRYRPVRG